MEINEIQIVRILKFLSLAVLAGGTFAVALSPAWPRRMKALMFATVGFSATWISGYVMHALAGGSMRTMAGWLIYSILLSLLGFHGLALLAHKPKPRAISHILAIGGLFTATVAMVVRTNDPLTLGVLTLVSFAIAALIRFWPDLVRLDDENNSQAAVVSSQSWHWFQWIARFEGLSLIILVLINMPLKRLAGFSLDGGTGTLGWIHGTLFLIYLQALLSTGRMLKWSWKQMAAGFIAANIPFGTFWFERWVGKKEG